MDVAGIQVPPGITEIAHRLSRTRACQARWGDEGQQLANPANPRERFRHVTRRVPPPDVRRGFTVWVMTGNKSYAHVYESAALPAVGDTILVQRTELDRHGNSRTMDTGPVPARVTRVRGRVITAAETHDPVEDLADPGRQARRPRSVDHGATHRVTALPDNEPSDS